MTCPDWDRLSPRRDNDPEAWERALEHSEICDRCGDRALAEEPSLLFRQLPAPTVSTDEIAAMKQAVAVLRRSSEQHPGRDTTRRRLWPTSAVLRSTALRAAALAALLISAAALQGTGPGIGIAETGIVNAEAGTPNVVADSGDAFESLAEITPRPRARHRSPAEDLPLVEAVDPSYGSVVQVVDDEISLVLVLPNDV